MLDGSSCSAAVLSEHWLLTAAHCVDHARATSRLTVRYANAPGQRRTLYSGPANLHAHPSYDSGSNNGVNSKDVGLVEVTGVPMNLALTGRAKLLSDSRVPWASGNPDDFEIVGWGRGTDPGSRVSCSDAASGVLRRDDGTWIWSSGGMVNSRQPIMCPGDSGGSWVAYRGSSASGRDYMTFAVNSGTTDGNIWAPHTNHAVKIAPHFDWIQNTVRNTGDHFGASLSSRTLGGWRYREVREVSRGALHFVGLGDKCMQWADTTAITGTRVEISSCHENIERQLWSPMPNGEIRAVGGLCLDVQGGRTDNRTPLWLYPCNGTLAQRFGILEDGTVRTALAGGRCVEVAGGNSSNGTPVQMFDCNGTASQDWDLTGDPPVATLPSISTLPVFQFRR